MQIQDGLTLCETYSLVSTLRVKLHRFSFKLLVKTGQSGLGILEDRKGKGKEFKKFQARRKYYQILCFILHAVFQACNYILHLRFEVLPSSHWTSASSFWIYWLQPYAWGCWLLSYLSPGRKIIHLDFELDMLNKSILLN